MLTLIAMAWRNLWRQGRRSLLTAAAMAAGVAMAMAMFSWTDGMFGMFVDMAITERIGHVQVHHADYPGRRNLYDALPDGTALADKLAALPEVDGVTVRLNGQALIGGDTATQGGMLIGVLPSFENDFTGIADDVRQGAWLGEEAGQEIVLGYKLAEQLEVEVGDAVVAMTQAADGSLGNALYTVVGTASTGNPMADRSGAYLHLHDLQALLALDDTIHEVAVSTASEDPPTVEALKAAITPTLTEHVGAEVPTAVETWWEVNPAMAEMMELRGVSSGILLVIVFGLAAVGVVNTMLMSVLERTREFGVLRALGVRPLELVTVIVLESVFLGVLGLIAGTALGLGAQWYMVTQGIDLSNRNGEGFALQDMQLDPVVYGAWSADSLWQPALGVLLSAVVAALYPAFRAASLRPVDALRQE